MNTRILLAPALLGSALSLAGCADHYAAEGAGAGAAIGAGVAAATGGNIATGAVVGAAAGAAGGYFLDRNDRCDGYDANGRLDDDCYGTEGYPVDPR